MTYVHMHTFSIGIYLQKATNAHFKFKNYTYSHFIVLNESYVKFFITAHFPLYSYANYITFIIWRLFYYIIILWFLIITFTCVK